MFCEILIQIITSSQDQTKWNSKPNNGYFLPISLKENNRPQTPKINNNINVCGSNKTFWFVNKQGSFSWNFLFVLYSLLYISQSLSSSKDTSKILFKICTYYLNVGKGKDGEMEERSILFLVSIYGFIQDSVLWRLLCRHTVNLDHLNTCFKSWPAQLFFLLGLKRQFSQDPFANLPPRR